MSAFNSGNWMTYHSCLPGLCGLNIYFLLTIFRDKSLHSIMDIIYCDINKHSTVYIVISSHMSCITILLILLLIPLPHLNSLDISCGTIHCSHHVVPFCNHRPPVAIQSKLRYSLGVIVLGLLTIGKMVLPMENE